MTHKPVIFLAFANSSTSPLPGLSEEDQAIYQLLHKRGFQDGHFHIHRESYADLNSLRYYFTEFKNRIEIFHYGGHADSEQLFLPSGSANSAGIAEMIAEQQNMRLVFLNGCSSAGQVKTLLKLGIPSIIATKAPIGDTTAKDFAKHFYRALELGSSIDLAFKEASAYAKANGKEIGGVRSMERAEIDKASNLEDLWTLFHHSGKKEVLSYSLPGQKIMVSTEEFVPNEYLIQVLWETLINEGVVIGMRKKVKLAQKRISILNSFPAPIAENLRKLLVPLGNEQEGYDQISFARLKQLAKCYEVLMEMMSFTLLAQLWETQSSGTDLKLSDSVLASVQNFLQLKLEERSKFRFIPFIRQLRQTLDQHKVKYFVEELSELVVLIQEDASFRLACRYFDLLRERLVEGQIDANALSEECKRAEEALATLLGEQGYLANYTLATIKEIDVVKYRHTPKASFHHIVVRLVDLLGGMEKESEIMDRFLDSRSVLLLKENNDAEILDFLNLSPFIIDENAFQPKSDKPKIFFFNHYEQQDASWCYEYVNNPQDPVLKVPGNSYSIIHQQLKAFEDIFLQVPDL